MKQKQVRARITAGFDRGCRARRPSARIARRLLLTVLVTAAADAALASAAFPAAGDLDASFGGDGKVTTRVEGGSNYDGGVALQVDGKVVVAGRVDGRFAVLRYHANGTLDASWGGDGVVKTNLTSQLDAAQAVAVQPDGKVIAAGHAGKGRGFALVRYMRNGKLDETFSENGKKFTSFSRGFDEAFDVAIQPDGKIVAAGGAGPFFRGRLFSGRFAVARYLSNGRLDPSFSGDGKVMTNVSRKDDQASGMALQPDGKIVAAGGAAESAFALARYNADGSLDSSFDSDGKVTTSFGSIDESASGVAVQTDGKIVAAGVAGQSLLGEDSQFALARYNGDGSLDSSFDGDGRVLTNFTNDFDGAEALALQADGKIVAAGYASIIRFALARYTLNGALDPSFGGDGKVTTLFSRPWNSGFARDVVLQPNGKIVASGEVGEARKFAVARYLGG